MVSGDTHPRPSPRLLNIYQGSSLEVSLSLICFLSLSPLTCNASPSCSRDESIAGEPEPSGRSSAREKVAVDSSSPSLLLVRMLAPSPRRPDLTRPCSFTGEAEEDDAVAVDAWTPVEPVSQTLDPACKLYGRHCLPRPRLSRFRPSPDLDALGEHLPAKP
jgi:hypothetical protein